MKIQFTKMHGLGNDFVVINNLSSPLSFSTQQIQFIADRHLGIGCDQILILESPQLSDHDFFYRIFNSDGSEVAQCGNGARCIGRYIKDHQLISNNEIVLKTLLGKLVINVKDDDLISVNMGKPIFDPEKIPVNFDKQQNSYQFIINEQVIDAVILSIGNPHCVICVNDIATTPVKELGQIISTHELFPLQVNVGFMQILNRQEIKLRVFERGAGETKACGSGACAAVVAGIKLNLLDKNVTTHLLGGDLNIAWHDNIMMSGPAVTVFQGEINL